MTLSNEIFESSQRKKENKEIDLFRCGVETLTEVNYKV